MSGQRTTASRSRRRRTTAIKRGVTTLLLMYLGDGKSGPCNTLMGYTAHRCSDTSKASATGLLHKAYAESEKANRAIQKGAAISVLIAALSRRRASRPLKSTLQVISWSDGVTERGVAPDNLECLDYCAVDRIQSCAEGSQGHRETDSDT